MTVRIRIYKRGGYEVDIRFTWPDGTLYRERLRSPVSGKSASQRWGEAREMGLFRAGQTALQPPPTKKEVPTLAEFEMRFIEGHCRANRQKPSGIEGKLSVFRAHLVPRFGKKRLDEFTNEDIQCLKAHLASKKPKTVNNVLTTLSMTLKTALEWNVIDEMPCRIRLLKVGSDVPGWYEFSEYQRLVDAAAKIDPRVHLLVLLAGDAGMRRGEIIALRFSDVDFARGILNVRRSMWSKFETEPKGFRSRIVPMTNELAAALKAHRHLRGPRVLYGDNGLELTNKLVRTWLASAQKRAGLEETGAIHRLRHTFCSMLASSAAPTKAIQELAGHQHISTTMKYMHLSPATRESAIRLLDQARQGVGTGFSRGDIVETGRKVDLSN
jgi:integrase